MPALHWRGLLSGGGIYFLGLGALLGIDLIVARTEPEAVIASWAAFKSAVFVGGALCLLGLDQALVRNPNSARRILGFVAVQILVIAALATAVYATAVAGFSDRIVVLYAAIALFAASILGGAYFRARFEIPIALLSVHLWKIIAMAVIVMALLAGVPRSYQEIVAAALAVGVAIPLLVRYRFPAEPIKHAPDTETGLADFYRIGMRFCASGLLLNLSLYLDQLLLNYFGEIGASAAYFRHVTLFLLPLVAANGFLGFIAGPYIRQQGPAFDTILRRYWPALILVSAIASLSVLAIGWHAFPWIYPNATPDLYLAAIISVVGFQRFLLIVSSAYLGVHASRQHLDRFVLGSAIGVAAIVPVYLTLHGFGMPAAYAIALAAALNWAARLTTSSVITWNIMRARNPSSNASGPT